MTEVIFLQKYTDNGIFELLFKSVPNSIAIIKGSSEYPDIKGTLKLYQTDTGVFAVTLVYGLPDMPKTCQRPIFALHIHSGDACTGNQTDPFANAKVHYNPQNCPHPYHSGDMPPLFSSGSFAWSAFFTDRFSVGEVLGLPVIIHSKPDDFTTQPSGNSGDKIACGIIMPTTR